MECRFYDTENTDGYFSGTIFIIADSKRYILDFGYDIEFRALKLMNCDNPMYNSFGENYSYEEIQEIKQHYLDIISIEIHNYIALN